MAPQTSDEAFDVRVKGLEEQVNDIKEKIFRTKARLLLLQETVVDGEIISGAKAVITHKNEMGATFVLESAAYQLDGLPIFTKVDVKGDLADKPSIEVFNNRVIPGNHQLVVKLEYRGHGFGPITYLDGYRFKVDSDNARQTVPLDEIVFDQRQVFLPGDPGDVGEAYGRSFDKPLVAVAG